MILFTRTPLAGRIKTRLQPECSPKQAAEIASIMIEETVRIALARWPGPVELCVWPGAHHALFRRIASAFDLPVNLQTAGNLGDKMQNAMTQAGFPCAVMGCDVPHCPPATLKQAFCALEAGECVVGPATDGGYYLLGLQQPAPELFEHIRWGEKSVLTDTLDRALDIGLTLDRLDTMNDVDSFHDLVEVAPLVPHLSRWLENNGF